MMEGQMKVHSSQNISGASQQTIAAAFTWTTEVDGIKKKKKKNTTGSNKKLAPCSPSGLITTSRSPEIPNSIKRLNLHCSFWPVTAAQAQKPEGVKKNFLFKISWDIRALGTLDFSEQAVWSRFTFYFSCQREPCSAVSLWSSRNVLLTTKLLLTLHPRSGEQMMTEVSCLDELTL